jgi:hypothetical protein
VSEAERRRIQAIARRLGYKRDPEIARLMEHLRTTRAQRRDSTLAVIIPELDREGLASYSPITEMLKGIRAQAEEAGFVPELFFLTDPGMTPARLRSILVARGIKGLILAPYASGVGTLDLDVSGFSAATTGYSIVRPQVHRACPNYLQMMDELIDHLQRLHFHRIGLVMTYSRGGIGHKLLTSSYLYYQSLLPVRERIPILPREEVNERDHRGVAAAAPAGGGDRFGAGLCAPAGNGRGDSRRFAVRQPRFVRTAAAGGRHGSPLPARRRRGGESGADAVHAQPHRPAGQSEDPAGRQPPA